MDDNLRRLVRELIERPESPTSLAVRASFARMLRPSEEVIAALIETLGWRFEVVDMDGRRIDKVLAERSTDSMAPMPETASVH